MERVLKPQPLPKKLVESAEAMLKRVGGGHDSSLSVALAVGFDLVIAVDRDGRVVDVSVLNEELEGRGFGDKLESWTSQRFEDLVPSESKDKASELIRIAGLDGFARPRQLNINLAGGSHSFSVAAVKLTHEARVLLLCRDLRSVSRLQEQLIEAQQRIEREYYQHRAMQTRLQALFQLSSDGLAVVEEGSLRIVDANAVAYEMLRDPRSKSNGRDRNGRSIADGFETVSRTAFIAWMARLSREPNVGSFQGTLRSGQAVEVRATLVRQTEGPMFLVSLRQMSGQATKEPQLSEGHEVYASVFDGMPDALVVSDRDGRVMLANQAFLELVQLANIDQVRGESLARWFARGQVDLSLLGNALKQYEVVREYTTDIRGEFGALRTVDVAGVGRTVNGQDCFAFAIRDVNRRTSPTTDPKSAQNDRVIPRSTQELRELVGRVPLKDIVAETSDLIERLCIEAALEITNDNRAASAEMLGLSRQSLYVKLRRYGVGYDENGEIIQDR